MTRSRLGLLVAGLAGLVVLASGCEVGTDDEMAPAPTRTVTATPSQTVAPAPATIPVGDGDVAPADVVWAQGSVLHVGRRTVDLAPIDIEAFVVVPGGVFLLADRELWFTDLARVRGTGQTEVTGVRVSADARHLVVLDRRAGQELEQAYDTRSGRATRDQVTARTAAQFRAGPGRFEVRTTADGVPVVVSRTGRRVPLRDAPRAFAIGGWAGDSTFYGVSGAEGRARAVASCDIAARTCRTVGRPVGAEPVVFATGR